MSFKPQIGELNFNKVNNITNSNSGTAYKNLSQTNSPKILNDEDDDIGVNDNNISSSGNQQTGNYQLLKKSKKKISKNFDYGETCESCSLIENAFQQIDNFMFSVNQRVNSVYFNTSLLKESTLNFDFTHSRIYYTIDKMQLPQGVKTKIKNLFVSLLSIKFFIV